MVNKEADSVKVNESLPIAVEGLVNQLTAMTSLILIFFLFSSVPKFIYLIYCQGRFDCNSVFHQINIDSEHHLQQLPLSIG